MTYNCFEYFSVLKGSLSIFKVLCNHALLLSADQSLCQIFRNNEVQKKASWYFSHTCYVKAALCRRSILSSEFGGKDKPYSTTTIPSPKKKVKEKCIRGFNIFQSVSDLREKTLLKSDKEDELHSLYCFRRIPNFSPYT